MLENYFHKSKNCVEVKSDIRIPSRQNVIREEKPVYLISYV